MIREFLICLSIAILILCVAVLYFYLSWAGTVANLYSTWDAWIVTAVAVPPAAFLIYLIVQRARR